ncbi:MAG: iron export ABC transporter permease subunit FetB [Lactobacillus sp.]|jgi:putative ABC transport system permease protein|nr:iron export ABC transporter permease subunit FetB [Lactobacillus sp.]MCH3905908.1 iron export ABC transporter permease subunit FetB [Lactobacillus sp.]MCH3990516.1 iron export ABC transporter permease subunit FetB [Lactobacillus sp.]MCH4068769.1 iron export ABC transporter permease subunit FetB [Lactobacillus sp.]MCI1303746.1 iron export ABC transporter permease subunit FetB [Lactobacillus sp.]
MKNLAVSNWSLVLAFALVLVAVIVSTKEKLGLSKDIFIAVGRAIIQLIVVGFILKAIFKVNNVWLTIAMTMVIIFNASWNASKRDPNPRRHFWQSVVAEAIGTYLTLGTLIASGTIKLTPVQVIPITGMIAGNEMVAVGLCYKALYEGFHDQRQQVLEKLALGANRQQASHSLMRRAIKTGMQPTIDSIKTVGLVNLPGMMSGLIFAGVDPVYAIRYQIMVSFMLLSASSLGAVIACYLSYRNYFNDRLQLLVD